MCVGVVHVVGYCHEERIAVNIVNALVFRFVLTISLLFVVVIEVLYLCALLNEPNCMKCITG